MTFNFFEMFGFIMKDKIIFRKPNRTKSIEVDDVTIDIELIKMVIGGVF